MSFDTSRYTFDPWNNFTGVVMPQGRVQLDSDWNEWLAELGRRIQAGTLDIVGRAAVPVTTKNGFKIELAQSSTGGTSFGIGRGRMYVDGLLAENHGLPAPDPQKWIPASNQSGGVAHELPGWDSALDEFAGTDPVNYNQQPYFPAADTFAPFPQSGGPYLIYLDVWQREVTFLEYPDLIEKAVGVDTAGRLQMVWQVKWLDVSNVPGINCSTQESQIPGWVNLVQPKGARLTTGIVQSSSTGPCCLNPNDGYTGLENQHYRIEIHQKGPAGTATFKWSRDNASVATGVTAIQKGGKVLTVQSTGKDDVLRFSANDWVEITDDWLELRGLPGELHQIASVSDQTKTITLTTAVSFTNFPVDSTGQTDLTRNTRITRWDQGGKIYKSNNTVWVDLDLLGSGEIPVPPAGTSLILENGITVSFDLTSNAATFNTGDFWTVAARATDGTVEYLDQAPPGGIYHHYARLAVVSLSSVALSGSGLIALPDQSQPPVDFLGFQTTPLASWPPNFWVSTQANAVNSSNFDLQVFYSPATAEGVKLPVTVESFTNLSLNPHDANYAQTILNQQSRLITVPSGYQPPAQPPAFSSGFSAPISLASSGTIQLTDTSSSPITFLILQITSLTSWPHNFSVSATPSGLDDFTLEISYAPSGPNGFATVERFEKLSLFNVGIEVKSEFIADVTPLGSPPPNVSALNLVTLDDCRSIWPVTSAGNGDCECTKLINPSEFDDSNTLQHLLDQYQNMSTQTVVCLSPGTYSLPAPLRLTTAHSNLMLKACHRGTVILRAHAGKEHQFIDGMIVLDNVKNVTLEGLTFSIPLAPFAGPGTKFAGQPIDSIGNYVHTIVSNLFVSIAVRPISCTFLTIENCTFEFPDATKLGNLIGLETFGAGIFAGGICGGLELIGNTFAGKGGCWFGFLQCPAVAFVPPNTYAQTLNPAGAPIAQITAAPKAITSAGSSGQKTLAGTAAIPVVGNFVANGGEVLPTTLNGGIFRDNFISGLAAVTLIVGEAGVIEITSNRVDGASRGFWLVSPNEATQLARDPLPNSIIVGSSIALGYPLPQSAAAEASVIPAASTPVRVHAGTQVYTDSISVPWAPDTGVATGGLLIQQNPLTTIQGAADSALYQTERVGNNFTYTISKLSTGFYTVILKFAEIDPKVGANQRQFNVLINNVQVLTNFDIVAEVGAVNKVDDKVFSNVAAVNNQITIQFVGSPGAPNPQATVSAVEIEPQLGFPIYANPGGTSDPMINEFWILFQNLLYLGQQAFANLGVLPLELRLTENDMHGLGSNAVLILGDDQIQNAKVSSLIMSGNRLSSASNGAVDGLILFDAVVFISAVLRCTVSGNELSNSWRRCSLYLKDPLIPKPGLVIMSNLFQGYPEIEPSRALTDPNIPAPLNTWDYLNTTI